jgi:hypothetical protein
VVLCGNRIHAKPVHSSAALTNVRYEPIQKKGRGERKEEVIIPNIGRPMKWIGRNGMELLDRFVNVLIIMLTNQIRCTRRRSIVGS